MASLIVSAAVAAAACGGSDEHRSQIVAWGKRFAEVETCILGDEPPSSDYHQAITLRELTIPTGEKYLDPCLLLTKDLERPPGAGSGDVKIERRWMAMKDRVAELATALAFRNAVDPQVALDTGSMRIRIAAALNETRDEYAELRAAAGLGPEARRVGAGVLGEPTDPLVLVPDEVPTSMMVESQAGVLALDALAATGTRSLLVRAPDRISTRPRGEGVYRAVSDDAWGVWLDEDAREWRVIAGALDPHGDPIRPGAVVASRRRPRDATPSDLQPVAAIGDGAARAIVYSDLGDLVVAESSDGGATWQTVRRVPGGAARVFISLSPARLDVWNFTDTGVTWLPIPSGARVGEPRDVPEVTSPPRELCRSNGVFWWLAGDRVIRTRLADAAIAPLPPEVATELGKTWILTCSDERAARVAYAGDSWTRTASFEVCDEGGCGLPTRIPYWPEAQFAAAFGDKQGFAVAMLAEEYLVLWRAEGGVTTRLAPHPKLALARSSRLRALVELEGRFYAVVTDVRSTRLLALP